MRQAGQGRHAACRPCATRTRATHAPHTRHARATRARRREAYTALKLVCWVNTLERRLFSAPYELKASGLLLCACV
jgi:hypothetical protein